MSRLKGKRCLIVGGTGGIGRAAAKRFLEEGARLVVAGLEADVGRQVVEDLGKHGPIQFIPCDATMEVAVDHLFRVVVVYLGGMDVLYHVTGGSGRKFGDGPLHECSEDGWQATLDLNLKSVFLTNRAAVRHFLGVRQPGVILNMASVLALDPSPQYFGAAAYTAAKGGVIALSRLTAARHAADGIRVNVLAPGVVDTPMAARAVGDPEIQRFLGEKQPLAAGPARPDDLAEAAVFLCSDGARLITGAVLPIDAGWSVNG